MKIPISQSAARAAWYKGAAIYGAIRGSKRLALFPGAGHEDLVMHDPKRCIRAVDGSLRDFTGWKHPVARTTEALRGGR